MDATVGKMLDRAQEYLDRMTLFFGDIRDRALDDEARLLTYHLARHKRKLALLHSTFSTEELNKIRNYPLRDNEDDFIPERVFNQYYLTSNVSPGEVVFMAVEFMDILACLYRWLSDQFAQTPASKMLKELVENEEKEMVNLQAINSKYFSKMESGKRKN
jgi:hypothetical protein